MSAGDKLPPKRKAFAEHYVGSARFNGTRAYRQAGYQASTDHTAESGAHKLVSNGEVNDYIDELIARSGIARKITPEVLKTAIFDVLENSKDANTKLRAAELLGRALAMFKDVSRSEDATTDALLATIKGSVPDDTLAQLAEDQGIDPESLGLSRH